MQHIISAKNQKELTKTFFAFSFYAGLSYFTTLTFSIVLGVTTGTIAGLFNKECTQGLFASQDINLLEKVGIFFYRRMVSAITGGLKGVMLGIADANHFIFSPFKRMLSKDEKTKRREKKSQESQTELDDSVSIGVEEKKNESPLALSSSYGSMASSLTTSATLSPNGSVIDDRQSFEYSALFSEDELALTHNAQSSQFNGTQSWLVIGREQKPLSNEEQHAARMRVLNYKRSG